MIPFKINTVKETANNCSSLKYGYSLPIKLATTPKKYCIIIRETPYFTNHCFNRLEALVGNDKTLKPGDIEVINCQDYQEYLITNKV